MVNITRSVNSREMCCFFFFKQKTAYEIKECDWSSDVCSSDLPPSGPEFDFRVIDSSGEDITKTLTVKELDQIEALADEIYFDLVENDY